MYSTKLIIPYKPLESHKNRGFFMIILEELEQSFEELSLKLEKLDKDINKKLDELSERIESYRNEVQ